MSKNNWVTGFPEAERERIVEAARITIRKPEGKQALDYLLDERKFTNEIIDKFSIGYCPPDVNHEVRGRIVTPIYSTYGELVAFSTRHLNRDHPARFLHEAFDKGNHLYGLYYAKNAIAKANKVIIVEGECDVACFHSYGFDMTIGLCGSAFTLFQISLLSRFCSNFYILLDGDTAGRKATKKALDDYEKYCLKAYELNFIPVYLPDGSDPDDFLIKGGKRNMIDKLRTSREECSIIF
jgi:DNA primase